MKNKNGFALLISLLFLILIGSFSLSIVQTNIFASNLNSLKYLHFQATIYLDFLTQYIHTHSHEEIANLQLKDNRYNLSIKREEEFGDSVYYIILETVDNTPIRLSEKIIK